MKDEIKLSEDWKKEYEKFLLTRKYSEASRWIGICYANPTIDNLKTAFGLVVDYVISIPLTNDEKLTKERKDLLNKLDEIEKILYGTESEEVQKLYEEYKIIPIKVKKGVKIVTELGNLPNLVTALRDVLVKAGEFATSIGLRVTLASERKFGLKRILEEEGFDTEELEEFE